MRCLETDADLVRALPKNSLVRHDNEPCRILLIKIDILSQHLKPKQLCCKLAADRCLRAVSIFCDLLDRQRRIVIRNLPPFRMALEILCALGERLRMRIDRPDILKLCPRQSDQRMLTLYDLLPNDIIFKVHKQVVVIRDDTRG